MRIMTHFFLITAPKICLKVWATKVFMLFIIRKIYLHNLVSQHPTILYLNIMLSYLSKTKHNCCLDKYCLTYSDPLKYFLFNTNSVCTNLLYLISKTRVYGLSELDDWLKSRNNALRPIIEMNRLHTYIACINVQCLEMYLFTRNNG